MYTDMLSLTIGWTWGSRTIAASQPLIQAGKGGFRAKSHLQRTGKGTFLGYSGPLTLAASNTGNFGCRLPKKHQHIHFASTV